MKRFFACYLFCLLFSIYSSAQVTGKTSRIRIHAHVSDLNRIRESGVDFDHGYYDSETATYINTFSSEEVQQILNLGYTVDILVEDVVAYTDSVNKAESVDKFSKQSVKNGPQIQALTTNFTAPCQSYDTYIKTPASFKLGSMGGFYNLTELQAQFEGMVANHPGLVTKSSIGKTLQGRDIWVIKISDNVATDENEPEVLYTGMHHSREGMSMMNLIFFMHYLLENYNTNPAIKELVNSRELFFIPVVNIDGFNYNTTATNWNAGRRFRRKNMAETTTLAENTNGSGGDGVDLNRNYGTYWGAEYAKTSTTQTGSSGSGESDSYRGASAFSEPETQLMRDFINNRQFKVALNYHCYGNWWIRPQGPDDVTWPATALSSTNVGIYNSIANLFTRYNCYVYGTPKQTVYPVNGYSDDFLFSGSTKSPVFSFSPEIGSASDDFWCPMNKIEPYAKELVFSNLQAAYTAGSYAELQDNSDVALPSKSGTFNFTVNRRGLEDGPITISLIPISNIQSVGNPVTITSLPSFGSSYNGSVNFTLPTTIPIGAGVRYAWKLETGGITISDTITKIYSPVPVFFDDMETSGNFSTNWARPKQGAIWGYGTGQGYNGSTSLTESPSGNYSNGVDQSVWLAKAVDLSGAVNAYLSFQIKYKSENCQDRLQVEISTNGVSGMYTPICTKNTINENRGTLGNVPALTGSTDGWIREVIDLDSYVGNNNIGLRFRFISSSSTRAAYQTDGFNIDNVRIVKTHDLLLPVRFEDLVAIRRAEEVLLRWKAHFEEGNFSHFEIERSQDGQVFKTIGSLTNAAQDYYNDVAPAKGPNYYRIKAVDADGTFRYSKTVLIFYEPVQTTLGYPNPANNQFFFEITSGKSGTAVAEVYSLEGKKIESQQLLLRPGTNRHVIQTGALPSGVYVVQVRDNQGKIAMYVKMVKK